MRVLTVKQPSATLIALGIKPIENRSWAPPPAIRDGTRFAIHAGQGWDAEVAARLRGDLIEVRLPGGTRTTIDVADKARFPRGIIVCTLAIAGLVSNMDQAEDVCGDTKAALFYRGPLGWLLHDVRPASSRQLQGRLSLWTIDDSEVIESTTYNQGDPT